jgi:thiol-disulfide isomerase/thioredoxin
MWERALILLALVVVGVVAWWVGRLWLGWRVRRMAVQASPPQLEQIVLEPKPAFLYFTTDSCAQCRLQQTPILSQLAASTGVQIHRLDAVSQTDLTKFYGVMTVPTTVLLDRQRRPVAVNHGLASLQKLQAQVASTA